MKLPISKYFGDYQVSQHPNHEAIFPAFMVKHMTTGDCRFYLSPSLAWQRLYEVWEVHDREIAAKVVEEVYTYSPSEVTV